MSISFVAPLHVVDAYRRRNWRTCYRSLIDVIRENGCEWLVPEVVGPLGSFSDMEGCTSILVQGNANRSRLRNIGLERASFDFVCFVDADMVMQPKIWKQALIACKQWKAYSPYSFLSKLSREQTKDAIDTFDFQWNATIPDPVCNLNLSGGISFFDKEYLNSIGRWDERFQSWGYEDAALNLLVHSTSKSFCDGATAVHLWHPIEKTATHKRGPSKVLYEKEYVGKDVAAILSKRSLELQETAKRYGSHAQVLRDCLSKLSAGDVVIEFGCGNYSTPIIKDAAESIGLEVHCYETDDHWLLQCQKDYASDRVTYHKLNPSNLPGSGDASLVFIDSAIESTRPYLRNDILQSVADAKIIVCHDTEDKSYGYDFSGFVSVEHHWAVGIRTTVIRREDG